MAKFKANQEISEASIVNFESLAEDVAHLIKEGVSSTDVRAEIKRIKEMAWKLIDKRDYLQSISSGVTDCPLGGVLGQDSGRKSSRRWRKPRVWLSNISRTKSLTLLPKQSGLVGVQEKLLV